MGYESTNLEHNEIAVERQSCPARSMGREAALCCCVSAPSEMFGITWRAFGCSWRCAQAHTIRALP
jgi:hypothetical protein